MAPEWLSSEWARPGTRDRQGVEAPWPLSSTQNDNQRKRIQSSEDTKRHQEMGRHRGGRGGSTHAGGQ